MNEIKPFDILLIAICSMIIIVLATISEAETFNIFETEDMFDSTFIPSKRVEVKDYNYKQELKVYDLDEYGVISNPVPEKTIRIEKSTISPRSNSHRPLLPLTVQDLQP